MRNDSFVGVGVGGGLANVLYQLLQLKGFSL